MIGLAAAGVLLACGPAKEEVDCNQLVIEQKFHQVINKCEDPFQVGTAYLGLAGFDTIEFFKKTAAAEKKGGSLNVISLLGLNESNIKVKRELINQAIRTVAPPATTSQAFVLLLAAFVGLSVITTEYLDNGKGGGEAFDDKISGEEVEANTGLTLNPDATLITVPSIPPYYQVTDSASGLPYLVECTLDAVVEFCDDDPAGTLTIYEDSDGSAKAFGTVASEPPDLTVADPVNLVVMLNEIILPISVSGRNLTRLESYLSAGTLDPGFPIQFPNRFPIGIVGYLNWLDLANQTILDASASADDSTAAGDGSPDEEDKSAIDQTIDTLRSEIDNGAVCFKDADPESSDSAERDRAAVAALLDLMYNDLYQSAPGTDLRKVPATIPQTTPPYFTRNNVVRASSLDAGGITPPDPTEFVFNTAIGFKFLYATETGLKIFDASLATARIDETQDSFQEDFNFIPRMVPSLAKAGDGVVDMIELLCFGSS